MECQTSAGGIWKCFVRNLTEFENSTEMIIFSQTSRAYSTLTLINQIKISYFSQLYFMTKYWDHEINLPLSKYTGTTRWFLFIIQKVTLRSVTNCCAITSNLSQGSHYHYHSKTHHTSRHISQLNLIIIFYLLLIGVRNSSINLTS